MTRRQASGQAGGGTAATLDSVLPQVIAAERSVCCGQSRLDDVHHRVKNRKKIANARRLYEQKKGALGKHFPATFSTLRSDRHQPCPWRDFAAVE